MRSPSTDFFDQVASLYGDRIFAFDHFTVSRTPEENAKMLLAGLPDKRFQFDVVTHSRGGLVLRNLVERTDALGSASNRFNLGRAVLVASPNEGTPLATPARWEDTIGWIANLLELFPDNPFTTGAEFVANGLVWIARHASGDLPGIHSMDGDGDLIEDAAVARLGRRRIVTRPSCRTTTRPASVLNVMLDVGADQFFGSANDLVVPSEGGWRIDRSGSSFIPGSRIGCFGPGGNLSPTSVTHVNFFSQPETSRFLLNALAGKAQPLAPVDPAKELPDRRLLRSGSAGVSAPAARPGRRPPAQPNATHVTGPPDSRELAAETPSDALVVTVVNGDLTFEARPLLLGHYRATRLTGTEKIMNTLIGDAMNRSLDLGDYASGAGNAPRVHESKRGQAQAVVAAPAKGGHRRRARPGRVAQAGRPRAYGSPGRHRLGQANRGGVRTGRRVLRVGDDAHRQWRHRRQRRHSRRNSSFKASARRTSC